MRYFFLNKTLNAKTYRWDFGDGQQSNEENPTHIFQENRIYSVKLVATSIDNLTSEFKSEITIKMIEPIADFTYEILNYGEIKFINKSQHSLDYEWDFGNGDTSSINSPIYKFRRNGSFKVILTSKNQNLTNSVSKTIEINDIFGFKGTIDSDSVEIFCNDNGFKSKTIFETKCTTFIHQISSFKHNFEFAFSSNGVKNNYKQLSTFFKAGFNVRPLYGGIGYYCSFRESLQFNLITGTSKYKLPNGSTIEVLEVVNKAHSCDCDNNAYILTFSIKDSRINGKLKLVYTNPCCGNIEFLPW